MSAPGEVAKIAVTGSALVGEAIFLRGMSSPNATIQFTGGDDNVGNGACANCHGQDARGGVGPMVAWNMLTRHMSMDNMPKFVYSTPDQVSAVLVTGIRPDGSKLQDSMPRYVFPAEQSSALIDYLKLLK